MPICHDNAYAELTYDGFVAPSFLAAPGAREAGIEIYSLSKALSMPGWRIAFAVGNAELIGRLRTLKTQHRRRHVARAAARRDPRAGSGAGRSRPACASSTARRRDLLVRRPRRASALDVRAPERRALRVGARPGRRRLGRVRRAPARARRPSSSGPGAAYGPASDGYVRLSLTVPDERLGEAIERIARVL